MAKVAELEGAALDVAVARALGADTSRCRGNRLTVDLLPDGVDPGIDTRDDAAVCRGRVFDDFEPSERWDQAGPIIERERIMICPLEGEGWRAFANAVVGLYDEVDHSGIYEDGSTPLIAAMRAFVASKLGEVVPDA